MTVRVQIKGLEHMRDQLKAITKEGKLALARALYMEGELIMGESKMPHNVPVDTGVLRSTGHVAPPEIKGGHVRVVLGYGGPAARYAARQHEDLTLRHPGGGRAKYLEIPAMERASVMGRSVAAHLATALAEVAKNRQVPR